MLEMYASLDPHLPEEYQFLDAGSVHWRMSMRSPTWRPPTDVYETEDAVMVRVEIGGMRDEDFMIQLDGRFLLIRGVRPDTAERRAYHQMEIRFGEFNVEVELNSAVAADQVDAVYSNGFLKVVLPKVRPSQIQVIDE